MLNDRPISHLEDDLLYYNNYVTPIIDIIDDKRIQTPLTIGVIGSWGSGKSTLLSLLQQSLVERKYHTIWFNPWLYKSEESLLLPLLHTIKDYLSEVSAGKLKESVKRISTIVAQISASVLMKTLTLNTTSFEEIEKRIEVYNQQFEQYNSVIRTLRSELQNIVNNLTNEGQSGNLVIFIDDLDRCTPKNIVEILENIKLFLDLRHTCIVIALDGEVVQQGIEAYYKALDLTNLEYRILTTEYIDKMIQVPFHLNPLSVEMVGEYLNKISVPEIVEEHLELFENCLLPNPRKIKRTINIFYLNVIVASNLRSKEFNSSILAKLILLQQQWYDLYRNCILNPELPGVLELVYKDQLNIDRSEEWSYLGKQQSEFHQLCKKYYQPKSRLSNVFTLGESFIDVDISNYTNLIN